MGAIARRLFPDCRRRRFESASERACPSPRFGRMGLESPSPIRFAAHALTPQTRPLPTLSLHAEADGRRPRRLRACFSPRRSGRRRRERARAPRAGRGGHAKPIVAPLARSGAAAPTSRCCRERRAAGGALGADGAHVAGAGAELAEAWPACSPSGSSARALCGARRRDERGRGGRRLRDVRGAAAARIDAASLAERSERVGWWAEIFETPCVAFARPLDAVGALAAVGADFVALGDAVWSARRRQRRARGDAASSRRAD